MVLGELGLLTEMKLPVICIIMNDGALDLIKAKQIRRQEPVYGTEFLNPDYEAICQAYRLDYYRVSNKTACSKALKEAYAKRHPAIIEALIDPAGYPTAPGQPTIP